MSREKMSWAFREVRTWPLWRSLGARAASAACLHLDVGGMWRECVFITPQRLLPSALTSSSDENVTAAGTHSRERASKWAYAARDGTVRQPSRLVPVDVSLSHGHPSACHRSLIVLTLISFMPTKFCAPLFFFLRHISEPLLPGFLTISSSSVLATLNLQGQCVLFLSQCKYYKSSEEKLTAVTLWWNNTWVWHADLSSHIYNYYLWAFLTKNDAFRDNGSIWLAGP